MRAYCAGGSSRLRRAQVNSAMRHFWKAIVPHAKRAIDRYFGDILQEQVCAAGGDARCGWAEGATHS